MRGKLYSLNVSIVILEVGYIIVQSFISVLIMYNHVDVFPLFAAALRPVFELCLSSRTNKRSSFLDPKYSHTTNFDLFSTWDRD